MTYALFGGRLSLAIHGRRGARLSMTLSVTDAKVKSVREPIIV
jgi:hypothetical protein